MRCFPPFISVCIYIIMQGLSLRLEEPMTQRNVNFLTLSLSLLSAGLALGEEQKPAAVQAQSQKQAAENFDRQFTVVAIESEGSKFWLPGTLIVKRGDKVKINLVNSIKSEPNTHGYAIEAYGIREVVARGEPKTVTFTADKSGIFTIYCQQHPKHIGGQLLVLE